MANIFYLVNEYLTSILKGMNILACVLTVQLNELVSNGQLQEYSIIRLDRYLRNDLKGQAAK